ncbi:uncharacterized protein G2W53_035893 [Senna tora]|uniref:Uncharacterized protein n=1 Tax=Senna tora TaxID=362788 RepID=A0A834W4B8_9FABA|nr:uncharacterized protein G2W53_035893 [Senna tora]
MVDIGKFLLEIAAMWRIGEQLWWALYDPKSLMDAL